MHTFEDIAQGHIEEFLQSEPTDGWDFNLLNFNSGHKYDAEIIDDKLRVYLVSEPGKEVWADYTREELIEDDGQYLFVLPGGDFPLPRRISDESSEKLVSLTYELANQNIPSLTPLIPLLKSNFLKYLNSVEMQEEADRRAGELINKIIDTYEKFTSPDDPELENFIQNPSIETLRELSNSGTNFSDTYHKAPANIEDLVSVAIAQAKLDGQWNFDWLKEIEPIIEWHLDSQKKPDSAVKKTADDDDLFEYEINVPIGHPKASEPGENTAMVEIYDWEIDKGEKPTFDYPGSPAGVASFNVRWEDSKRELTDTEMTDFVEPVRKDIDERIMELEYEKNMDMARGPSNDPRV